VGEILPGQKPRGGGGTKGKKRGKPRKKVRRNWSKSGLYIIQSRRNKRLQIRGTFIPEQKKMVLPRGGKRELRLKG